MKKFQPVGLAMCILQEWKLMGQLTAVPISGHMLHGPCHTGAGLDRFRFVTLRLLCFREQQGVLPMCASANADI